jgi:hypothetical protein
LSFYKESFGIAAKNVRRNSDGRFQNQNLATNGCLGFVAKGRKCCGVMNCSFRKHFAVHINASQLQPMHETRIIHTIQLASCVNSGNPKLAVISFLQLTANIGVGKGLHHGLIGHFIVIGFASPIALTELQDLISSFARHHCAFDSCHFLPPPLFVQDHALDRSFVGHVCVGALAEASFALGGFLVQNVTFKSVRTLYFTGFGEIKSLFCPAMGFNLRHDDFSFQIKCKRENVLI